MNHDKDESDGRGGGPVHVACEAQAVLGEGPVYLAGDDSVYWVDIKGPAVHRLSLSSLAHDCWPMPEMIGWILPRR